MDWLHEILYDDSPGSSVAWVLLLRPIVLQVSPWVNCTISFWTKPKEWRMTCGEPLAHILTIGELTKHTLLLYLFLHSMSLTIDTKIIRPWNSFSLHIKVAISFWISWRTCSVMCPAIQFSVLICLLGPRNSTFPFCSGFWWIRASFQRTIQSLRKHKNFCLHEFDHLFVFRQGQLLPCWISPTQFWHSRYLQFFFANQFLSHVEQFLYSWLLCCISDGAQILGVIFPKKDRCMHWRSHERSQNKRMPFNFSQFISWRTIQYRSHSLIHFVPEWDWSDSKNIACLCCLEIDFSGWTLWTLCYGSHRTFFRIHCLVRTPFHGYLRAGHRICIHNPHMRIFHLVTFREVSFVCFLPRVSPRFLWISLCDLQVRSSPGLADAVDDGAVELPARLIDTQFITGFDMATTLSS